ncbi:MAG TPA: T9SS type A sorting domain-containing protein [Bacteroidia bacterium]|nr:T9SS type A sorting domain-containing protein [Bacteroidia bacterium]
MKNKIIYTLIFIFGISFIVDAKYVRFAVNMQYSGMINSNDAYMSSTFQSVIGMGGDLTHGFLHLTQSTTDTNIYYAIYNIPAFQMYEYQFELGVAGYDIENIPVESQSLLNGYRWLYIDSLSDDTLILPEIYYSGNNSATEIMYRIKVNMSNESVSSNGVHIAGNFQNNDPASTIMYSFGNSVYEYMAYLTPGTQVDYKFYNGNTATTAETVPSACAQGGNRIIASVDSAQILPTVCFSDCINCSPLITSKANNNHNALAPNPVHDVATLTFYDNANSHSISIIDIQGRTLKQINNITSSSIEINTEMLEASCYYLQIINDLNETSTLKLIID